MSGGKKNSEMIEEILKEILDMKKQLKLVDSTIKQNEVQAKVDSEILQHLHSVMTDISSKIDEGMPSIASTSSSSKKPASKITKKDDAKPKLNVMTFFKQKFRDDPDALSSIVSKKEIEDLYQKHIDEINKKKKGNLLQFQLSLIYKELIKDNAEKVKALRKLLKEDEEKDQTEAESSASAVVEESEEEAEAEESGEESE